MPNAPFWGESLMSDKARPWSDYYPRSYRCAIRSLIVSQVDELVTRTEMIQLE
jgi:hypothetical protein